MPSSIQATINIGGQSIVLSKNVHAGVPEFDYMDFEEPAVYQMSLAEVYFEGANDYMWILEEGNCHINVSETDRSKASIMPFTTQPVVITVRAINECGYWEEDISFTPRRNSGYSSSSLSLHPNPAVSFVNVSLSENKDKVADISAISSTVDVSSQSYTIQLWSSLGIVKTVQTNQPEYQLDLSGVAPGFYYVHVIKDGQTYRKQLVVK